MTRSALLAVLGLLLMIPALGWADYLANGDRSTTGFIGFLLLCAVPGLALIAWALGRRSGLRWTLPLIAVAFCLLGLDVVDSSRSTVVLAGWALAGASAGVTVGITVLLARGGAGGTPQPAGQRQATGGALATTDPILVVLVTCPPLVFIAVFVGARMVTGEP